MDKWAGLMHFQEDFVVGCIVSDAIASVGRGRILYHDSSTW